MNQIFVAISCFAGFWLSSASQCPIAVNQCLTSKCQGDGENPLCSNLQTWGCPNCDAGSFQKSHNHPCITCDTVPGCNGCADWQGCISCQDGYRKEWNNDCGFHICIPPQPQPEPEPPIPLPPAPTASPNQECPYFVCPNQCETLYEHGGNQVCADLSCTQHCQGCNPDFGGNCQEANCVAGEFCPCDDEQSNQCQCHYNGCDQCDMTSSNQKLNYFKLNYDYPCQQCYETFGEGCLHCSDFHGCQQCAPGYTRTPAYGCGSESDQYDANRPIYYCLPDGAEPCDSFGITEDCDCDITEDYGFQIQPLAGITNALSAEECCDECNNNPRCAAFTYLDFGGEFGDTSCWMHTSEQDLDGSLVPHSQCSAGRRNEHPNCAPPTPEPDDCGCNGINGLGYIGGRIDTINDISQEDCCDACRFNDRCDGYTHVNQGESETCLLFSGVTDDDLVFHADCVSGSPSTNCDSDCDCDYFDGIGHQNGPNVDVDVIPNLSIEQCCDACHNNEACQGWTRTNENFRSGGGEGGENEEYVGVYCFLFSTPSDGVTQHEDCVSGNLDGGSKDYCRVSEIPHTCGCEYYEDYVHQKGFGDDVGSVPGLTADECCHVCETNGLCQGWTLDLSFAEGNEGLCFLYSEPLNDEMQQSPFGTTISGNVVTNCGEGGNGPECPYFVCPNQCDILYEHGGNKVCADLSCSADCKYCNPDFGGNCQEANCVAGEFCPCDDDQSNMCQCHQNGCDQCKDGYFKLNFDFPCQSCHDTFEGCLHCSDFHGCQQCATGYTRTPASGCGHESDQYDPSRPIYYCLPDGAEPCDGFGEEDEEEPPTPQPTCFTCPSRCETLYVDDANNEVCADTSCTSHCKDCIPNLGGNCQESNCQSGEFCPCDDNQSDQCQCHSNGCDQCEDGYFKINFDYPCLQCQEVFGPGCLHCTDKLGCQQCDEDNGYQLKHDCNCGSESDQYGGECVGYCVHANDDCGNNVQSPV